MSPDYIAIRAVEQQVGSPDMPIIYMSNIAGPLAGLQAELHWYLFDLARLHQLIYKDLERRDYSLQSKLNEFKSTIDLQQPVDEENKELIELQKSRVFCGFNDEWTVIDRCKSFSDEFCIIGLWATSEKFMGNIYKAIEAAQTNTPIQDINAPYRWDQLITKFEEKSISLSQLDRFFDANECRVLNNAIKHSGFVNERLTEFPFFLAHQGKELKKVNLEMQRYYNGVSSFIGSLIEAGNRIIDPNFNY